MSKFATKAAANMFCQARYEAAKSNERLSSREGAAEEIGIDRTRLARIELGSTIPYQEEVLLILHTADWHIGQFKGPVVDGVNLRLQDTVKCLEYMVEVDFVLIPCLQGNTISNFQFISSLNGVGSLNSSVASPQNGIATIMP